MLAAGKSLQLGDLERNDVATVQDVYALVYAGRNKMPGFGEGCAPKGQCTFAARLSDAACAFRYAPTRPLVVLSSWSELRAASNSDQSGYTLYHRQRHAAALHKAARPGRDRARRHHCRLARPERRRQLA